MYHFFYFFISLDIYIFIKCIYFYKYISNIFHNKNKNGKSADGNNFLHSESQNPQMEAGARMGEWWPLHIHNLLTVTVAVVATNKWVHLFLVIWVNWHCAKSGKNKIIMKMLNCAFKKNKWENKNKIYLIKIFIIY